MKAPHEKARKQLERIEELARNEGEGFGSAVYDPQEQPSGRQASRAIFLIPQNRQVVRN